MKTRTYMHLSLLIPFLVWGLCLLLSALVNRLLPNDLASNGSSVLSEIAGVLLVFYVLGILFWFIPYLVLSLTLLLLSMRSHMEILKYLFVLSPFAMAILMMIEVTFLSMFTIDGSIPSSNLASTFQGAMGLNVVVAVASLVGGYICVCLGYGIYKILQLLGMIKKETNLGSEPMVANGWS